MKREKGRFLKGVSYSPNTQFKKGQHWREKKLFWERDWLADEYVKKGRSAGEIASGFGVTENSILYWLKKHRINTRSMSEIRGKKLWVISKEKNGMFGRTGSSNPNWKGGCTAERQSFYSSLEWKNCIKWVWHRYCHSCGRCKKRVGNHINPFAIHHIVSFKVKPLRAEPNNLILLWRECHHFIHSKKNIDNEYLLTYEEYKTKYGDDSVD